MYYFTAFCLFWYHMKRWFLGLTLLAFLLISGIYLFIPGKLEITCIKKMDCPANATFRNISDSKHWARWFPGISFPADTNEFHATPVLKYRGYSYRNIRPYISAVRVLIEGIHDSTSTSIIILQQPGNTVSVEWHGEITTGLNPIEKLLRYNRAVNIKKNMQAVLNSMSDFLEKTENVYGVKIERVVLRDSSLVATKTKLPSYPGTPEVYHLVRQLKAYLLKKNISATGDPMLNVTKTGGGRYTTMVAMPVSASLTGNGDIFFTKMVPGNFMTAQVRGNQDKVNSALNQLKLFVDDYNKTAMAIPFQTLVTDRSLEPDATHWITRLYIPVIE